MRMEQRLEVNRVSADGWKEKEKRLNLMLLKDLDDKGRRHAKLFHERVDDLLL